MPVFPEPLDVEYVVDDPELVAAIRSVFRILRDDGTAPGGITIGKPRMPRALVYVGPCPVGTDEVIRYMAKPAGFNVSPIRDPDQLTQYETATKNDPKMYSNRLSR
jgi:hypothetical protein